MVEDRLSDLNRETKEEGVDIKALFFKVISNWKLFIIFIILFLSIAFLVNRYTEPIFQIKSTILIKDNANPLEKDLLDGLSFMNSDKNIENEIGIINSYSMVKEAIMNLDFLVSYYRVGHVVDLNAYNKCPFTVIIDSNNTQLINLRFYVTILSKDKYILEAKGKDVVVSDVIENKTIERIERPEINLKKELFFGEEIVDKNFKFKLVLNYNFLEGKKEEYLNNFNKYFFIINNLNNIIESYKAKLAINSTTKKSSIIELLIEGHSAIQEINFINKLTEVYIKSGLDEKNKITEQTIGFIDNQLFNITDSLRFIENKLQNFRMNKKVLDVKFTSESAFDELKTLETDKSNIILKSKYYNYLLEYLENNKNISDVLAPSTIGINDPLLTKLVDDLNNLYDEKATLSFNSTKKNPYLNILEYKIENIKTTLIKNVKNIIKTSEISLKDINQRINIIDAKINDLPETEKQLINIQRKFNLNDNLFTFLLQKRAELGIAKASNMPNCKVIDEAKIVGSRAKYPNKKLNYIIALVLGLVFPFIYLLSKDYIQNTIEGKKDLENITSIPILGVIGRSDQKTNLVVLSNPKSPIAESFRSIRTNLQYMAVGGGTKITTITSSISGEGKTFCAINLGTVLALSGKKTVIIGLDLRKPKIYGDFGLKNAIGVSTYLIGQCTLDQMIQRTHVENLDIIAAGPIPPNPAELIETEQMETLMESLKKRYDNIILDTPPITLVTDALLLTKYTNAIIYVVRQGYTKKELINLINDLYKKKKVSNISIVVNDVKTHKLGYYNYGYGGYGYSYGYGYGEEDKQMTFKKRIKNLFSGKA